MKLFPPNCLQYVGILTISRISNAVALISAPRPSHKKVVKWDRGGKDGRNQGADVED